MMKAITSILAIFLSITGSSAFVAPRPVSPTSIHTSRIQATMPDDTVSFSISESSVKKISAALTVTAATVAAPLATLAAATQDDDYVYGAVAAPGGLGLAAGLGVLAILTAAVPVLLAPGEDAFNEMKDRDESKWGKR